MRSLFWRIGYHSVKHIAGRDLEISEYASMLPAYLSFDRIELEVIILPELTIPDDYLDTCIAVLLMWMLGVCTAWGSVQHRVCLYTCMSYNIWDSVRGGVQQNTGQTVPITPADHAAIHRSQSLHENRYLQRCFSGASSMSSRFVITALDREG